jgi:bifunctional N-acetylglucosamine-1-phosphate-uridyltransferase/glucosamine-1-phosphate-acetyltransferase GlmU-like protein
MPDTSITTLARLFEKVRNERTFALVESQSDLSGHIIRREGRIQEVVQSRLVRPPSEEHTRDVGAYAFCNTAEFRSALRSLTNDNVRGEYIFADVVGKLVKKGWDIASVRERPELARGVNTSAEMLSLACGLARMPRG